MSDEREQGGKQESGDSANKAKSEFERYKARLGTIQPMQAGIMQAGMVMPFGAFPAGAPGWAIPPSVSAMATTVPPVYPAAVGGAPPPGFGGRSLGSGSLIGQLMETVRLGVGLLNAALASGTTSLSGLYMVGQGGGYGPSYGGHECGCGCSCSCCEPSCCCPSCCEPTFCTPSCSPGVHGCYH